MADIISLFSNDRIQSDEISADFVLKEAKGKIVEVLILGYNSDGLFYVDANKNDKASMLYLIEDFKFRLLSGELD